MKENNEGKGWVGNVSNEIIDKTHLHHSEQFLVLKNKACFTY